MPVRREQVLRGPVPARERDPASSVRRERLGLDADDSVRRDLDLRAHPQPPTRSHQRGPFRAGRSQDKQLRGASSTAATAQEARGTHAAPVDHQQVTLGEERRQVTEGRMGGRTLLPRKDEQA
jgi:hypothetical protein